MNTVLHSFLANFYALHSADIFSGSFYDSTAATAFLSVDILQYAGVVFITALLANNYGAAHDILVSKLVRSSKLFIYASLVLNTLYIFTFSDAILAMDVQLFSGLYSLNASTQILKILVFVYFLALYEMLPKLSSTSNFRILELPLLMHITLALSVTMVSSTNLALILLALEGFSLALYVMTALSRTYGGITASVKYFAFGTLGSIFLFWGTVHIYAVIPTLSTELVSHVFNNTCAEYADRTDALNFAAATISFGFMLKIGAAPVHQWVADTYAGVHLYITAYFSIFVKLVIFIIFLKIGLVLNYENLLVQFSILSLIVGCFMSINQTEIKRLLAYSSVVHVGFLLMGDAQSSLVYLFTYLTGSLLLFAALLQVRISGQELIYLNDLRHVRNSSSRVTTALVIALSSSAGLPPFAGFYGKFAIWSSLLEDIYLTNDYASYACLFISLSVTLITIYYYMRVIAYLFICSDFAQEGAEIFGASFKDFYDIFFSLIGMLSLFTLFWSLLQHSALKIAYLITLFF